MCQRAKMRLESYSTCLKEEKKTTPSRRSSSVSGTEGHSERRKQDCKKENVCSVSWHDSYVESKSKRAYDVRYFSTQEMCHINFALNQRVRNHEGHFPRGYLTLEDAATTATVRRGNHNSSPCQWGLTVIEVVVEYPRFVTYELDTILDSFTPSPE